MILTQIAKLTKPLYLGLYTVRQMQSRQIVGTGTRKVRERLLPRLPVDFDRWYERQVPEDPSVHVEPLIKNTATLRGCVDETTRDRYRTQARDAAAGTPTFLNCTLRVKEGTDISWYDDRFDELPLLWSLKLYGFQPLDWLCKGFDPREEDASELRLTFDEWILDWIRSVEIGGPRYLRRAWTPWAVSLRILHWSRYLAWRRDSGSAEDQSDFERAFRRELYKNSLFLRNHIERGVGGNHLIENGAALLVAGLVFAKDSWINVGISILTDAADEQFLDGGFHFERSPMYHVVTLTRYLTICDLLGRSNHSIPTALRTTANEGTTALQFLRPPDGRIPLLNDAVYGEALPLDACLRYSDTLGFGDNSDDARGTTYTPSSHGPAKRLAGYRWLRTDAGAMLVDGDSPGPVHLPGHSHSDTLSILLWLDDQAVVTDTGTFGYVRGCRRRYARGVRAHNTVQVGNTEPITLGGKYLMGPHPEPTTRFEHGPVSLFEGCYEATPFVGPKYLHHRSVFAGDHWWIVRDTVNGHDGSSVRSRLHLHPAVDPFLDSTGRARLAFGDKTAFVYPIGKTRISITTGQYFPRFGVATDRPVLELHADNMESRPTTFGFLVTRRDLDKLVVEKVSDGVAMTGLRLDSGEYQLPEIQLSPK